MKIELIVLVVFISVWLIILAVSGVLALLYHFHHTPLMAKRQQYYQDWKQLKAEVDLVKLFEPLPINFPLPDPEEVYYLDLDNPIYIYSKKKKEYKFLVKTEGLNPSFYENYFDDLDVANLKSSYNLIGKTSKKPVYYGHVYISNFRVMINDLNQKKSHQIPLKNIRKAYISMIEEGRNYRRGYLLQTDSEIYEIVSNEPTAVLIINELLRRNKNYNVTK